MLSFQVTYYAKVVHKRTIVQRLCTRLCTRRLYRIFLPETVGPAVFGTFPVAGLIILSLCLCFGKMFENLVSVIVFWKHFWEFDFCDCVLETWLKIWSLCLCFGNMFDNFILLFRSVSIVKPPQKKLVVHLRSIWNLSTKCHTKIWKCLGHRTFHWWKRRLYDLKIVIL